MSTLTKSITDLFLYHTGHNFFVLKTIHERRSIKLVKLNLVFLNKIFFLANLYEFDRNQHADTFQNARDYIVRRLHMLISDNEVHV